MKELLKIGSEISTPLGLGGLIAVILFLLLHQVLKSNGQQSEIIMRVVNGLFLLSFSVFAFAIFTFVYSPTQDQDDDEQTNISFTTLKPVVIGIYPNDLFGPYQEQGLKAGVEHFCKNTDVRVLDIDNATVKELKNEEGMQTMLSLESALKAQNVLAISGPSITEFTPQVIAKNAEISKASMFISSAAPLNYLNWKTYRSQNTPLFRISSGIDRRGQRISNFLKQAVLKGKKIGFLVEQGVQGKKSFGEVFFDEIKLYYNDFFAAQNNGLIKTASFSRDTDWENETQHTNFIEGVDVLFYLGVGNDYKNIVQAFYSKPDSNKLKQRPLLLSWMHAHSLEPLFASADFFFEDLVEITDLYISQDDIKSSSHNIFLAKFQKISPAMRDQAFSFDAAAIICDAYSKLVSQHNIPAGQYIQFDRVANAKLASLIESGQIHGVSGDIGFGPDGENPRTRLSYLRFNKKEGWLELKPNSILGSLDVTHGLE
jgi:hypothetical protein